MNSLRIVLIFQLFLLAQIAASKTSIIISGGNYKIVSGDTMGGNCTQNIRPFYNGTDLKKVILKFNGSCKTLPSTKFLCNKNLCSALIQRMPARLQVLTNTHYNFSWNAKISKLEFFNLSNSCANLKGGAWIEVPKNSNVGQNKNFCVMKYEAKKNNSQPQSRRDRLPWTKINQFKANAACKSLGNGYQLPTNAQWQTIARNIENANDGKGNFINWSNGKRLGDSMINIGNTYSRSPKEVTGKDDANWSVQKRSHTLSNGNVIWDLSGNVWEWIRDKNNGIVTGDYGPVSTISTTAPRKWLPKNTYSFKKLAPHGGFGFAWLLYKADGIIRGGAWNGKYSAGIFAVTLGFSRHDAHAALGFRCVKEI